MKAVFAICILFLLLAGHAESRRHRESSYKLFIFGDNFVDNGNTDKTDRLTWWTRNWYPPYGMSENNHLSTGRFSDGKLQSDFIAMLLGRDRSPAPENQHEDDIDSFGMNFAVAFSDVRGSQSASNSTLKTQINNFRRLLDHGLIDTDISRSVALVAFSGYDYTDIPDKDTDNDRYNRYVDGVTHWIAQHVLELRDDIGVTKVLVNMMEPMGCSPRYTRTSNNYTECIKDDVSETHNRMLKEKLDSEDSVLLLDLHDAFTKIIHARSSSGFQHRHIPCCESYKADGYCGQFDMIAVAQQYRVCDNPEDYFYFDEWHPTQAGWKAVVDLLKDDIKDFLDINSSS